MRKLVTFCFAVAILFCFQIAFGTDLSAAVNSTAADGGILQGLASLWEFTGFANVHYTHVIMIVVGLFFIFLAIKYDYEPLLLIPIGTGVILGNIPFMAGYKIGLYEEGSVFELFIFWS